MTTTQEKNQLIRIPLLSIFGAAVIYFLFSVIYGPISSINQIDFSLGNSNIVCFALPFSISRIWDVLAIGIFSFLLVKAGQYIKNELWDKEGPLFRFSMSITIFVLFVFVVSFEFSIFSSFLAMLYFVPIYVFLAVWFSENTIKFDWFFSGLFGLLGGLFIGLKIGLVLGLLFSLMLGIILAVAATVGWLIKTIIIYTIHSKVSLGFKYRTKKCWNYCVNFIKGE